MMCTHFTKTINVLFLQIINILELLPQINRSVRQKIDNFLANKLGYFLLLKHDNVHVVFRVYNSNLSNYNALVDYSGN